VAATLSHRHFLIVADRREEFVASTNQFLTNDTLCSAATIVEVSALDDPDRTAEREPSAICKAD